MDWNHDHQDAGRPAHPAAATLTAESSLRGLGLYVMLALGLSWAWLVPLAVEGSTVVQGGGWPTHLPALVGPALAAVAAATFTYGREGGKRLARRVLLVRVQVRWWLVAVAPLLVAALTLVLMHAAGRRLPSVSDLAVYTGVPSSWGALGVAATVLVVNGLGEVTGWRGFRPADPVEQVLAAGVHTAARGHLGRLASADVRRPGETSGPSPSSRVSAGGSASWPAP